VSPDITGLLAELLVLGEKPDLAKVESRLRLLAPIVAEADALTRAAIRSAVIETLASLQVRGVAALTDAALGLGREPSSGGQSHGLEFETVEPAAHAVDGAALLTDIATLVRRFVVIDQAPADTLALLIVNAHAHEAADISPIGVVTSPTKRCGKSTLLRLVLALAPRPLATSNITSAAVFRAVEAYRPTLVIDEADTFVTIKEELRGILNAGHTRDLAYVVRSVGDDHEPRKFSTWCLKFIGLIGHLPDTLRDRSITMPLRRRLKSEPVERLQRRAMPAIVGDLPARLTRWTADHLAVLRSQVVALPEALNDRQADNWEPLLAIADLAGGDWPARARAAALALSGQGEDQDHEEVAVAALRDVGALLTTAPGQRLASADVIGRLTADPTGRWAEYRAGRPITPRQLARLLERFKVKPRVIRLPNGTTPRGYHLTDLADPLSRYVPPVDPQHPQHANSETDLGAVSGCATGWVCCGRKITRNWARRFGCCGCCGYRGGSPGGRGLCGPGRPEERSRGGGGGGAP
jgi:hypothetical protein